MAASRLGGSTFHLDKPEGTTRERDRPPNPGLQCREIKLQNLCENTCGGFYSGRNSQPRRRVLWRDPHGPRMYTKPPTWESAREWPDFLVGSFTSYSYHHHTPSASSKFLFLLYLLLSVIQFAHFPKPETGTSLVTNSLLFLLLLKINNINALFLKSKIFLKIHNEEHSIYLNKDEISDSTMCNHPFLLSSALSSINQHLHLHFRPL